MADRVILHCDLNNFYASVECLYRPEIAHCPVAVSGNPEKRHGVILAKNNLAKSAGVQTGEPVASALEKCPDLTLVPPNFSRYMKFSKKASAIYQRYTSRIEPFGIDESWLDITECVPDFQGGVRLAHTIRQAVREELGLTISVGVSWNKIFAKLGSDLKKPDAVSPVSRQNYRQTVWPLPASDLLYVGRATRQKLERIGVYTIGDIASADPAILRRALGKWGITLSCYARGMESTPVARLGELDPQKGIGNSTTCPHDLRRYEEVKQVFYVLAESIAERMRRQHIVGKTIQIHLRDLHLCTQERQMQLTDYTQSSTVIAHAALELLYRHWNQNPPLRSVGIRISGLQDENDARQIGFFTPQFLRQDALERCVDSIRSRYGHWGIRRALSMVDESLNIDPLDENTLQSTSFYKGERF